MMHLNFILEDSHISRWLIISYFVCMQCNSDGCLSTSAVLWLGEPSRGLYQAELSLCGLAPFAKPFRVSGTAYYVSACKHV